MNEIIYNILYFADGDIINEAAICSHNVDGSDKEKSEWLIANIASDISRANPVKLANPISQDQFIAMQRLGRHLEVFESLFNSVGAPTNPFCCITPIVAGEPRINIITDHSPLSAEAMQSVNPPGLGVVKDWLTKYATKDGFDFPRLLNDDYFTAIRLLYNEAQYVSCMKLLVSFIDTMSFLANGDKQFVFIKWLNEYADLRALGITSAELWELRNSLLHMTNLDSRLVLKNKIKRIGFCAASPGICSPPDRDVFYFNIFDLIQVIAFAISKWICHINANQNEFIDFVERYDRILSDDRAIHFKRP